MESLYVEDKLNYLRGKYAMYRGAAAADDALLFDPWINPDEGHIPVCTECSQVFELFKKGQHTAAKDMVVEMEHTAACLWFDYFRKKILAINPKITFKVKNDSG